MTESNKERRARVANEIRVKASPIRMPLAEFNDRYRGRQIIPSIGQRSEIERVTQEMFCDECLTDAVPYAVKAGALEGTLLHVSIEKDPLGNFWRLSTMRCYHCGFEEHVPLTDPQFSPDEINSGSNLAGSLLRTGGFTPGPVLAPDPYVAELTKRQHELKQQQAQAQQAMGGIMGGGGAGGGGMGVAGMSGLGAMGQNRNKTATEVRMQMQEANRQMAQMQREASEMSRHMLDSVSYGLIGAAPSQPPTSAEKKTESMMERMRRTMGLG